MPGPFKSDICCRLYSHESQSICIPSSIDVISESRFRCCESLSNVLFESGRKISNTGDSVFQECPLLQSICIPSSPGRISSSCFGGCTNLQCGFGTQSEARRPVAPGFPADTHSGTLCAPCERIMTKDHRSSSASGSHNRTIPIDHEICSQSGPYQKASSRWCGGFEPAELVGRGELLPLFSQWLVQQIHRFQTGFISGFNGSGLKRPHDRLLWFLLIVERRRIGFNVRHLL